MIGYALLFLLGIISSTSDDKLSNNAEFHYLSTEASPTIESHEREQISNEKLKTENDTDQNFEDRTISWKSANGNISYRFEFDKDMSTESFKTWEKHVNRLPLYGNIAKYGLFTFLGYKVGKLGYQLDKSLGHRGNRFLGPPSLKRASAAVLALEVIYMYAVYRIFEKK